MSHGPGRLQRAILEFMQTYAARVQRTPQREHWPVDRLVVNVCRHDQAGRLLLFTSRQQADARKRVRRACDRLVAAGLLVQFGTTWALPPETPAEAKVRRKRLHISERQEQQQQQQSSSAWLGGLPDRPRPPIDHTIRRKLFKALDQLGSDSDNIVLVAARQAERMRRDLGCSWSDLLAT